MYFQKVCTDQETGNDAHAISFSLNVMSSKGDGTSPTELEKKRFSSQLEELGLGILDKPNFRGSGYSLL